MQLNFNIKDLDLFDVGRWNPTIRLSVCGIFFALILFLGYFFIIQRQFDNLNRSGQREMDLKQQYQLTHDMFLKISRHEKEIPKIEEKYTGLLKQAPTESNIAEFLASVSRLGLDSGLNFESFDPLTEQKKDFYTIQPFRVTLIGDYHHIANFIVRLAKMDRLVTFEIFSVKLIGLADQEARSNVKQNLEVNLLLYSYFREKTPDQKGAVRAKI